MGRLAAPLRPADHAGRGPLPTLVEPLPTRAELESRLRDPQLYRDLVERPLADVVADHLDHDVTRGIALTDGLIGTFADVHAADGLAGRCFLYHLVGNGTGLWRVPVGGMGAVSGAMAAAARRGGAELVTRATVTALEPRADGVTVHWTDDDGRSNAVDAGHVVSGAAPTVLAELTGTDAGEESEPGAVGAPGERHPTLGAAVLVTRVVEADLDRVRVTRVDGELGPALDEGHAGGGRKVTRARGGRHGPQPRQWLRLVT